MPVSLCASVAVLLLAAQPVPGANHAPIRQAVEPGALAAAKNAKIVGKVKGVRRWRDRFTATVRGVRGDTAEIVASRVIRGPKYRLAVPGGFYSIISSVTDRRKRAHYEGRSKIRRFKGGARKRVDVRIRRTRTRGSRSAPEARSGDTRRAGTGQAGPAVGVTEFTVGGIRMDGFFQHPLIGRPCTDGGELTVVEMRHRAGLIEEIERSQGEGFDPSTRIPRGRLIEPQTLIAGTGTISGGQATVVVALTDPATGRIVGIETVSGPFSTGEDLDAFADQVAEKIAERLCKTYPFYYKVLAADFTETTSAKKPSGTGLCDEVGGFSGSQKFSGTLGAAQFSPEFKLDKQFGTLDGRIWPKVPSRWTNHQVTGCKMDQDTAEIVPCAYTYPDQSPTPDGVSTSGFSIRDAPGDPAMVTLTWAVSNPSVGAFDAGNEQCYTYIFGNLELSDSTQTVPLAKFSGRGPQTLTFTGERTLNFDSYGPVTITHSWTITLTIQRVNESGNPI